MKPIKITDANINAITAALKAVNGKATAHTYQYPGDIEHLAVIAEKRLEKLGIAKAERAGATLVAVSGSALPNAYKYSAIATRVVITRRGAGWYLTEVSGASIYGGNKGETRRINLTPAQDAKAIEVLRREYGIIQPAAQPAAQPLAQVA
jgi:hypothetical protein